MKGLQRFLAFVLGVAVLLIIGFIAMVVLSPAKAPPVRQAAAPTASTAAAPTSKAPVEPADAPAAAGDCTPPGFEAAAQANALSITTLQWSPFRRPETGWETYAPHIAAEIGAACPPDSTAFASALARWQTAHDRPGNGVMDAPTFALMNTSWEMARPFVRISRTGVCPAPPSVSELVWATPRESYLGKRVQLTAGALAAYRRLTAAARSDLPQMATDLQLLTIFSGYRDPFSDAARCARVGDCGNVTRALCSAHRTGTAVDIYLGTAPGRPPDSTADADRLYQTRLATYAWLVKHAAGYGWINYPFEPWHWEWTGAG